MFAGGRLAVPIGWEPLWRAFLDLHETRAEGFGGPAPITFAEIDAYARLMRQPFEPHHVAGIRAIDRAWMDQVPKEKARPAAPALSAAAFDAVF